MLESFHPEPTGLSSEPMENISQKSLSALKSMLAPFSSADYPDNVHEENAVVRKEQQDIFFYDEEIKGKIPLISALASPEVTEKANNLSKGNHKPGSAISQNDYETILDFITFYKPFVSEKKESRKRLQIIENLVKAARSEASPKGLISTLRLYDLLEAAHYHKYRVKLNRGKRYFSLIGIEHAKEWVRSYVDYHSAKEIYVKFQRDDLFDVLSLASISIKDVKTVLEKVTTTLNLSDSEKSDFVSFVISNQPHATKQFKEFSKYNTSLALAQVDESKSIVKEHRQVSLSVSFLLTFAITAAFLFVLTVGSAVSNSLDGIAFIEGIMDMIEIWHIAIIGVGTFAGIFGVSEYKLSRKKQDADSIGAKKYYSESEYFRKQKALKFKKKNNMLALDSGSKTGKGYDIAAKEYVESKLSLSSGSLAFDAVTSGGFLKGAFNRVYCENNANFHHVLVHTVTNATQGAAKALVITTDGVRQYFTRHHNGSHMTTLSLSADEPQFDSIKDCLKTEDFSVIIVDKMDAAIGIQVEKTLNTNRETIDKNDTPVIILQDIIEDDEAFDKAVETDFADQIVEVYTGSAENKDDKSKIFINVVENTITALTEEATTVKFSQNTTKTKEILELGIEQGFLDQIDNTTIIDIQTGHAIPGNTAFELEKNFEKDKELYHTISNKVCRILLNSDAQAIESRETESLTDYEPNNARAGLTHLKKVLSKTPIDTPQKKTPVRELPEINTKPKAVGIPKQPILSFEKIKQQYEKIIETITSYQMEISKAIEYPAFNDSTVPAVQEMQIQLRKTTRLMNSHGPASNVDLDDLVDNVDILQVKVEAAEKAAAKIAWNDISVEERKEMELAENLIKQLASPGNPDELRRTLYGKLKKVVTKLNSRHKIIPTEIVMELEANSALALPSAD